MLFTKSKERMKVALILREDQEAMSLIAAGGESSLILDSNSWAAYG